MTLQILALLYSGITFAVVNHFNKKRFKLIQTRCDILKSELGDILNNISSDDGFLSQLSNLGHDDKEKIDSSSFDDIEKSLQQANFIHLISNATSLTVLNVKSIVLLDFICSVITLFLTGWLVVVLGVYQTLPPILSLLVCWSLLFPIYIGYRLKGGLSHLEYTKTLLETYNKKFN